MKKLKWIILFIMILLAILFLFATCKKTKAIEPGFNDYTTYISERDQDHYNISVIYDLGSSNIAQTSDFFIMQSTSYVYLAINNNNNLYIVVDGGTVVETINLGDTRLINVNLLFDTGSLYLIIYKINFTTQSNQNQEPIIDGISRTMLTRYNLSATTQGQYIINKWETDDLPIKLITSNVNYIPNLLLNYAYISYTDTPQDISTWVGYQLSNYSTYNNLIHAGYLAGNEAGYLDGFDDGEERGYSDGYDEGEQAGYDNGYYEGRTEGLAEGEDIGYRQGYNVGYTDGQAGNTAITPVFNTLSGVFSVVGSVLAIELVPHIPLGIFILVPLFFAAIGLILWIWRRN